MMLLKITKNLSENTCAGISLSSVQPETTEAMVSCEFCEIFKNTFLYDNCQQQLLYRFDFSPRLSDMDFAFFDQEGKIAKSR